MRYLPLILLFFLNCCSFNSKLILPDQVRDHKSEQQDGGHFLLSYEYIRGYPISDGTQLILEIGKIGEIETIKFPLNQKQGFIYKRFVYGSYLIKNLVLTNPKNSSINQTKSNLNYPFVISHNELTYFGNVKLILNMYAEEINWGIYSIKYDYSNDIILIQPQSLQQ